MADTPRPPRRPAGSPGRPAGASARPPARRAAPTPDAAGPEAPARQTSLTDRWWWSGAALALVGVVVAAWQWRSIADGESVWATWVVAGLGLVAVVVGGLWLLRDRPRGGARGNGPDEPAS
jgi:hypothetical protein